MCASAHDISRLFAKQRRYLEFFFENLDHVPLQEFCQNVVDCCGTIIFSGVGKSGFVAEKISASLMLMGTKSLFLNPSDALYGSLGIVEKDDLVVLLSKSGTTIELLRLIPHIKGKGAKLLSVSSNKLSSIARDCDTHIFLPLERELCPFDLAPVTSTAIQMIFGDICAAAIMKAKSLAFEPFAVHSTGGFDKLKLTVRDIMKPISVLPLCGTDSEVIQVLPEMSSKGFGCVLVCGDDLRLHGTFTDGDLRRHLATAGSSTLHMQIKQLASNNPRIITIDGTAEEALKQMEQPTVVSFVPVVTDMNTMTLAGLVSMNMLVSGVD